MLLLFFSISLATTVLLAGCHKKELPPLYTDRVEARRKRFAKDVKSAELAKMTKEEKEKEKASLERIDEQVSSMWADVVSEQSRSRATNPRQQQSEIKGLVKCAKLLTLTDTTRISDILPKTQEAKTSEMMLLKNTQMPMTDAKSNKVMNQVTISPSVSADKSQLSFSTSGGGQETVRLTNRGKESIAIKCRCSDNSIFTVEPVFSKAEPGQTVSISVQRRAVPPKQDKVVFEWLPLMPGGNKDLAAVFKNVPTVESRMDFQVVFD